MKVPDMVENPLRHIRVRAFPNYDEGLAISHPQDDANVVQDAPAVEGEEIGGAALFERLWR
jgi:hypothetical protein